MFGKAQWVAVAMVWPAVFAADHPNALRAYSTVEIEVDNKRNEKGQKLPDDAVPDLHEQLAGAIVSLHQFQRVEDYTDPKVSAPQTSRAVVLKLQITGYTGARNNAGIDAVAHFVDKETGKELFQEVVTARLRYDTGATSAAIRKLARSTSDVVKRNW
jgi:hypothetical protein